MKKSTMFTAILSAIALMAFIGPANAQSFGEDERDGEEESHSHWCFIEVSDIPEEVTVDYGWVTCQVRVNAGGGGPQYYYSDSVRYTGPGTYTIGLDVNYHGNLNSLAIAHVSLDLPPNVECLTSYYTADGYDTEWYSVPRTTYDLHVGEGDWVLHYHPAFQYPTD